jgi:hypothetical protein
MSQLRVVLTDWAGTVVADELVDAANVTKAGSHHMALAEDLMRQGRGWRLEITDPEDELPPMRMALPPPGVQP